MRPASSDATTIGLVLTGGGARAAYQAGVLAGIRRVLLDAGWPADANPFQVFAGTSAGAINATVLAAGADAFFDSVARLSIVWGALEPAQMRLRKQQLPAIVRLAGGMAAAVLDENDGDFLVYLPGGAEPASRDPAAGVAALAAAVAAVRAEHPEHR